MDITPLFKLSYGLYVLTSAKDDKPYGCIINTSFQITSSPVRIAVSVNKDNYTHGIIKESGVFGITILSETVEPSVIGTFGYTSGKDTDKFANFPYTKGKTTGVPLLTENGMATLECKVISSQEVDTHTVFFAEVVDTQITKPNESEMTYKYYHEVLKGKAPKNAPTYVEEREEETVENNETWVCSLCKYEYNESTPFNELADDWKCPICGADKSMFNKQ